MKLFTVNQATHLYVAKAEKETLKEVGDFKYTITPTKEHLYCQIVGALGEVERTDLIPVKEIMWASVKTVSSPILYNHTVSLTDDLVLGQEYILNVEVGNYIGVSPLDSKYWKFGAVRATKAMVADVALFYEAMAESLKKNMSREAVKFMDIEATPTGITLTETEPDWILGLKQRKVLTLKPIPGVVEINGVDTQWGSVTTTVKETLPNGPEAADMEWFFHGERGDQYRDVRCGVSGVDTKYIADPSQEYKVYDIHYAYAGTCEDVQKSEKDLLIMVPKDVNLFKMDEKPNGINIISGKAFIDLIIPVVATESPAAGSGSTEP